MFIYTHFHFYYRWTALYIFHSTQFPSYTFYSTRKSLSEYFITESNLSSPVQISPLLSIFGSVKFVSIVKWWVDCTSEPFIWRMKILRALFYSNPHPISQGRIGSAAIANSTQVQGVRPAKFSFSFILHFSYRSREWLCFLCPHPRTMLMKQPISSTLMIYVAIK